MVVMKGWASMRHVGDGVNMCIELHVFLVISTQKYTTEVYVFHGVWFAFGRNTCFQCCLEMSCFEVFVVTTALLRNIMKWSQIFPGICVYTHICAVLVRPLKSGIQWSGTTHRPVQVYFVGQVLAITRSQWWLAVHPMFLIICYIFMFRVFISCLGN